jgi:hypothetical protein
MERQSPIGGAFAWEEPHRPQPGGSYSAPFLPKVKAQMG